MRKRYGVGEGSGAGRGGEFKQEPGWSFRGKEGRERCTVAYSQGERKRYDPFPLQLLSLAAP